MKLKTFSYAQLNTWIHRLSGVTKLLCFLLLTSAVMFTYDIRVILCVMVLSYILMFMAKIRFSQVRVMFAYVLIFLFTNFLLTFLFDPQYGVRIYGTKHVLLTIAGSYVWTQEQLFYELTKFCKYFSAIPLGMIFILTTNPSEFASSLSGVGVSYKVGTSLSLTLRYFPDVAHDYDTIKLTQEARGLDMSKKASLVSRIKNASTILAPLIFTTMDRIELITNAMDLRGFGKHKTRTWYARKPLGAPDYISIFVCALILAGSLYVRVAINHSYFFNPFIR